MISFQTSESGGQPVVGTSSAADGHWLGGINWSPNASKMASSSMHPITEAITRPIAPAISVMHGLLLVPEAKSTSAATGLSLFELAQVKVVPAITELRFFRRGLDVLNVPTANAIRCEAACDDCPLDKPLCPRPGQLAMRPLCRPRPLRLSLTQCLD